MIKPNEEPASVAWQCEYTLGGISYWWDYPDEVSAAIESKWVEDRDACVEWTYVWPHGKDPPGSVEDSPGPPNKMKMRKCSSQYEIYPGKRCQTNTTNGVQRSIRRVIRTPSRRSCRENRGGF